MSEITTERHSEAVRPVVPRVPRGALAALASPRAARR